MLKKLMLLSFVTVAFAGLVGCGEPTNEQKADAAMKKATTEAEAAKADSEKAIDKMKADSEKAADDAGKAIGGALDSLKK